jgi:hypothetical protein
MALAHGHGYCYLQIQGASGAAFDGASNSGVVSGTRTGNNVEHGGNRQKQGVSGKYFLIDIFTPTFSLPELELELIQPIWHCTEVNAAGWEREPSPKEATSN